MKTYELTYIITPEVTSEEALTCAKDFESFITDNNGTIAKQQSPGAKALSYPINKKASGFVGTLEFQLEPEKLVELKNSIEKNGKITRFIVIIKKPTELRKSKRSRSKLEEHALEMGNTKTETDITDEEPNTSKNQDEKQKVELKDIEQKLDELLK